MAKGRMLNTKISRDKRVAMLIDEVGAYGGLFYTWTIAHLDRDGRVDGDPAVLKGMIAPRLKEVTLAVVETTLTAAHRLGLVVWWEDEDGDRYLAYPKFRENQANMRYDREAASEYPAPPTDVPQIPADPMRHDSGKGPAKVRPDSGEAPPEENRREEKRREEKRTEQKAAGESPEEIKTLGDLEAVLSCRGLAAALSTKARDRFSVLIRAGPIPAHEIEDASAATKRKAATKGGGKWDAASYFLGTVEGIRKDSAEARRRVADPPSESDIPAIWKPKKSRMERLEEAGRKFEEGA